MNQNQRPPLKKPLTPKSPLQTPLKKRSIQQPSSTSKPDFADVPSSPLLKLHRFLTHLSITANWRDDMFEQVIVTLDEDPSAKQLHYVLQIAFVEAIQAAATGKELNFKKGATLLFAMLLPIEIPQEKKLEVYQLFAMLNRILPLGYLGLNDGDEKPLAFFNYRLLAQDPYIDMFLVVNIIEIINAFLLQLVPEVQKLMQEDMTVDLVLEEVERRLIENAKTLYQVTKKFTEDPSVQS